MNDITYLIVRCVVIVLATIVSTVVIPYIKARVAEIKDKQILEAIQTAVQAAEQTLTGGEIKKEDVLNFMYIWLKDHKMYITEKQLDNLIESAVYVLKQNKKGSEKESE